tara:strand:- start:475 stop:2346 length:1872 start_codon:yes stop_codon:yes gene_type:complete
MAISGEALAYGDWLAMITVIQQSCSLKLSGAWTPPVQCLNTFLGNFVFPNPITYLLVTMGLKITMLYALYRVFVNLTPDHYNKVRRSTLALMIIVFLVIGGGGRFLIGGTELILNSSVYSGMWAQLLVLVALASFVKGRLFTAGTVIALAVFIHPANTFNVFVILMIVLFVQLLQSDRIFQPSRIFLFFLLGSTALLLQYIAAFGMPSLDVFTELPSSTDGSTISNAGLETKQATLSNSDWYAYVLSQDPDDLSLIWLLSSTLGAFYLSFFLVGIFLAGQIEGSYQPTVLLSRLPVLLTLASTLYLFCCVLIEYFQFPTFVFAKLIVVQPRRAVFLPVFFLSYYFVRYILEFFWRADKPALRYLVIVLSAYSWFFFGLLLNTYGNHISAEAVITIYLSGFLAINGYYWARHRETLAFLTKLPTSPSFFVGATVIAIVLKASPFISAQTLAKIDGMFLEKGPRSFNEYLVVNARLSGDDSFQDFQGLVNWIRLNTPPNAQFVSAGFSETQITQLPYLTERNATTLNVYRYRGGLHFLKKDFDARIRYFEALLGIRWQEMSATNGVLDGLQDLVENMDEDHFRGMTSLGNGKRFDYFITQFPLDLEFPIAYRGGDIVAYEITHPR